MNNVVAATSSEPVRQSTQSSFSFASAAKPAGAAEQTQQVMLIPPEEDPLLRYLTNMIMRKGERKKAARIVSRTLLHIHAMTRAPPLPILREAILTASPAVKVRSQLHGTKQMFKPIALDEKQRTHYGVKWLLTSSATRPERTLEQRLAREMIDILQVTDPKENAALKKKVELHTLAMRHR
jgi:small subunit ribosomal protein S7